MAEFTGEGYTPMERYGHPDDGDCFEVWEKSNLESVVTSTRPGGDMTIVKRFRGESAWSDAARFAYDAKIRARHEIMVGDDL